LFELTPENASGYLSSQPGAPAGPWQAQSLGGGVSNLVLLVRTPLTRFVLKQSLGRLRVEQEWFADRTRIHRECAAMAALVPHLPRHSVPAILFEDRRNCVYAMEAAPEGAEDWKSLLLNSAKGAVRATKRARNTRVTGADGSSVLREFLKSPKGAVHPLVACQAAEIHAALITSSWRSSDWEKEYGDQTCFGQLRLDPYYRFTAARHPQLADRFAQCMEACQTRRQSLVHGDFSPKNLLVRDSRVMVIDFEVIHFGDPAFDAAFLLNHLLLKAAHLPLRARAFAELAAVYWQSLLNSFPGSRDEFTFWTIRHLGCLHLARVDGKSPAEYLTPSEREQVRRNALALIGSPPPRVEEIFDAYC